MKREQRIPMLSIVVSMLKIGVVGFGGGSALIPVFEKEAVARGFIDKRAFVLHTVIANITPGALPVKLAALLSGRANGAIASVACALAVAFPGAVATVGLIALFNVPGGDTIRYVEFAAVGITAFIIVLLLPMGKHLVGQGLASSWRRPASPSQSELAAQW